MGLRLALILGTFIFFLTGIIFIALKLMGVITWGWIWVLCPFWSYLVLTYAITAIVFYVLCLNVSTYFVKEDNDWDLLL